MARIAGVNIPQNKVVQVALKTLFRLRKEKPDALFKVRIGSINEQKKNRFRNWFEVGN